MKQAELQLVFSVSLPGLIYNVQTYRPDKPEVKSKAKKGGWLQSEDLSIIAYSGSYMRDEILLV